MMGGEVNEFAFWGDVMGLEHEDDALKASRVVVPIKANPGGWAK